MVGDVLGLGRWCSDAIGSEGLLMGALDGSDFGELMVAFACTSGCGSEGCLLCASVEGFGLVTTDDCGCGFDLVISGSAYNGLVWNDGGGVSMVGFGLVNAGGCGFDLVIGGGACNGLDSNGGVVGSGACNGLCWDNGGGASTDGFGLVTVGGCCSCGFDLVAGGDVCNVLVLNDGGGDK
ncbi:hypothetical protein V6N13_097780 [Hibiscus sabdariffa]